MEEELDRKLVERIAGFSKTKGYAIKKESHTVTLALNEMLNIAGKKGSDSGKQEVVAFLQKNLKKADELCRNGYLDEICTLVESMEEVIRKEG